MNTFSGTEQVCIVYLGSLGMSSVDIVHNNMMNNTGCSDYQNEVDIVINQKGKTIARYVL